MIAQQQFLILLFVFFRSCNAQFVQKRLLLSADERSWQLFGIVAASIRELTKIAILAEINGRNGRFFLKSIIQFSDICSMQRRKLTDYRLARK